MPSYSSSSIIRVAETHRYPQDYDVETGQRTAPVVKPQDWEDRDLGVSLRVTPIVDEEGESIDLELQPEIMAFRGFDKYIVGYNTYAYDCLPADYGYFPEDTQNVGTYYKVK